ncbi:MAG TPA: ABC transporter permease [Thermoanaerobaculaceae bacterium]|nr:ABC transporter permease [Thermoanaerobaculaceae bacterium]
MRGSAVRWPPLARRSALALAVVAALAVVGPLLCQPPDAISDPAATALLAPGSRRLVLTLADGTTLAAEQAVQVGGDWEIRRLGKLRAVPGGDVRGVESRRYWLGTDALGRDVLARLLWGGRVSLALGLLALAVSTLLGAAVGLAASWVGGAVDATLMRLADAVLAVPMLVLVLLLTALLRPSLGVLAVVIGLGSWMGVARLMRAQVQALKQRDFVLGLRAIGASPARILLRHIVPNTLAPLGQDAALRLGDLILIESSLSFLGFGVQPPAASWGSLLADGQAALGSGWWLVVFPGCLLAATVLAAALLAEGLQERLRHLR